MGTPLIASDCMGLRETIADTPTFVFPSEDLGSLVAVMRGCLADNKRNTFQKFIPVARSRFDVSNSAEMLCRYIGNLLDRE